LPIPVGTLTDRYGGRVMFTGLLAFSALPAVLFGYADGYWALIGVGSRPASQARRSRSGVPFVAKWFPAEQQGAAVGLYGMVGYCCAE
jgi:MFS transporter, NNP family, nitrate/nitrite transporter